MKSKPTLRQVVWIPIVLCVLGLSGLVIFGTVAASLSWEALNWSGFFRDISLTLIVIGALGLLLELSEFSGYFEERLLRIMLQDEYVARLDPGVLKRLSITAMRACVVKEARNDVYRAEDVFNGIYANVIPLVGEIYRERYMETIEIALLEANKAEAKMGLPAGTIPGELKVSYCKTTTAFTLVAAQKEKEVRFSYKWSTTIDKIPGVPSSALHKYVQVQLKLGDGKSEPVTIRTQNETDVQADLAFEKEIVFRDSVDVQLIDEEYDGAQRAYSLIAKVNTLTRGIRLNVVSETPIDWDSEVFGLLTGKVPEPQRTANSIHVEYPGWLLPNDGYCVYNCSGAGVDGGVIRNGRAESVLPGQEKGLASIRPPRGQSS